jgi:hypothetical protein
MVLDQLAGIASPRATQERWARRPHFFSTLALRGWWALADRRSVHLNVVSLYGHTRCCSELLGDMGIFRRLLSIG